MPWVSNVLRFRFFTSLEKDSFFPKEFNPVSTEIFEIHDGHETDPEAVGVFFL